MKCLKEPLFRRANRQDNVRGVFFEGRFKSIAILDEVALLAVGAYIDLNPVAAGIAEAPETSKYTSIKKRVEYVEAQGRTAHLEAADHGSVVGSQAAAGPKESLWLCPIEDRRRLDSSREGMLEGLSLGSYLLLVDYTGRLYRTGKATISADLAGIFARLRSGADGWCARMEKLVHAAGSAVSLRSVESGCERRQRGSTSDASATSLGVRLYDADLTADRIEPAVTRHDLVPHASGRRGLPIIAR